MTSGDETTAPSSVRLQKALANAGVASRRVCEEYITSGRVRVNGQVVTVLGTRIDPDVDEVAVDGSAVQLDTSKRYVMLNKPRGVVSSMKDEQGRPDLTQFTDQLGERLFNVGRLDVETCGLLLLTNDGEVAHVLAHPSYGVQKTYVAKVRGSVEARTVANLTRGIELDDGPIAADRVRVIDRKGDSSSMVEITLHSGRNRIVRRMMAAVGHPVIELVRRSFGPLTLGGLKSGAMRDLTKVELGKLLTLAREAQAVTSQHPRRGTAPRPATGTARRSGSAGRRRKKGER
ncbi:pseudouridine synthase [Paramicrobacterium sp. CJ85]|uniref:pseudouridine synthase n=1 Tax=Paramicrobacterium sp. CJ85 TaxID=3445355 RepID=UPI003F63B154